MASVLREYPMIDPLVGDIKMSVQDEDHKGWLKCDGRPLEITKYKELYYLIGSKFGMPDADHFMLPNPAGRVLGAIGSGNGLTTRNVGDICGEEVHLLTINEIPSHTHPTNSTSALGLMTTSGLNTMNATTNSGNEPDLFAPSVKLTINNVGGSLAHNVMQPTLFLGNVFMYSGIITPYGL